MRRIALGAATGAVTFLLLAANALGFGSTWGTGKSQPVAHQIQAHHAHAAHAGRLHR